MDITDDTDAFDVFDLDIEFTDDRGKVNVTTFKSHWCKEKRLLCSSYLNNTRCKFGNKCTYAHSYSEQNIDGDRIEQYRLIFDDDYIFEYIASNDDIEPMYNMLLHFTNVCNNCNKGSCSGGYNCKYGATKSCLKLCKQDFLSGECVNNEIEIEMDRDVIVKMATYGIRVPVKMTGCQNGIHLSMKDVVPYYVYLHNKDTVGETYNSTRSINLDHIYRYFIPTACHSTLANSLGDESDSSYDDLYDILDDLDI